MRHLKHISYIVLTPWRFAIDGDMISTFNTRENVLFASVVSMFIAALNVFGIKPVYSGSSITLLLYFAGYTTGVLFLMLLKSYLLNAIFRRYNSNIQANSILFIVICATIPEGILNFLSEYMQLIVVNFAAVVWSILIIALCTRKAISRNSAGTFIMVSLIYFICYNCFLSIPLSV